MARRRLSGTRIRGFSLIELAVILTVLSFIAVTMITGREETQKLGQDKQVTVKMKKVRDAIARFYSQYGYYPCPADPTLPLTSADFGVSKAAGDSDGECGNAANHLFYHDATAPDTTAHNVIMGVIPVRSLGLTADDMMDSWGNRVFYAVDKRFTSTVACATPDIRLLSSYNPASDKATNITTYSYGTVPYALMSMGSDGLGAYPYDGGNARKGEGTTPPANITNAFTSINHGIADNTASASPMNEKWNANGSAETPPLMENLTNIFIGPRAPFADGTYFDDIVTSMLDDRGTVSTTSLPTPPVSGYQFWLDGGDISTMFTDSTCTTTASATGNSIKCWRDKGPNSWHATNAGAAATVPVLDKDLFGTCLNAVRFDGGDVLSMGAAALNYRAGVHDWTVFMAIQGVNEGYYLTKGVDAWSGGTPQYQLQKNASVLVAATTGWWDAGSWVGTSEVNLDSQPLASQFSVRFTKATSDFAEGTKVETVDMYVDHVQGGVTGIVEDTATASASDAILGAVRTGIGTGVTEGLDARIAEVLIYQSALSEANRKSTECYLAEKWKLLPVELTYVDNAASKPILRLDTWCPYQYSLSGSALVSWTDLAPRTYSATPGSAAGSLNAYVRNAPVFSAAAMGGKGGFVFDGTKSLEIAGSISPASLLSAAVSDPAANKTYALILAGSIDETAGEGGYIIGKSDGTGNKQWEVSYDYGVLGTTTDGAFKIYMGGQLITVPYSLHGPFVLSVQFFPKDWLNEVVVDTLVNNGDYDIPTNSTTIAAPTVTVPSVPMTLGARPNTTYSAGSPAFKGTLADISILNDATNPGYMICYLGAKYGITMSNCTGYF